MSVCTCIAQDRAHIMQVLAGFLSSPLSFGTLAAVWSTTLRSHPSIDMADGTSSAEDSPDDDSDLAIHVQLLDTRSSAQARLWHRGKIYWQPNDFSIFLITSSYMYLSIYIS